MSQQLEEERERMEVEKQERCEQLEAQSADTFESQRKGLNKARAEKREAVEERGKRLSERSHASRRR